MLPASPPTRSSNWLPRPLEKILYQIDGVEYVYSMARESQAIITVRFYVGQDRERSLVKLFKKIDENQDIVPPGVTGWVVKPVEIDDVPVVTLALTSATGRQPSPSAGSARRWSSGWLPCRTSRAHTSSAASHGRFASTSIRTGCRLQRLPAGGAAVAPRSQHHPARRQLHSQ